MMLLEIIKYLLKYTIISTIQVFSFVYFVAKAHNTSERTLAIKEGIASISYVSGIILITFGKWEIGLIMLVLSIAYTNYFIHEDSRE